MTLTIKLDGNWSSFQLANNTPPLSVTGSVIAPSARIASWHGLYRDTFSALGMCMFEATAKRNATVPPRRLELQAARSGVLRIDAACTCMSCVIELAFVHMNVSP